MSTQKPDPDFTSALLSALEVEAGSAARARGEESIRPAYMLRELPKPPESAPVSRPIGDNGPSGAASLVQDSAPAAKGITCPRCSAHNSPEAKFCAGCGYDLRTDSAAVPVEETRAAASVRVALVSINEDGTDGQHMAIEHADTVIGRAGDIRFPTDAFLSPKHARISTDAQRVYIEDLYSLNGTYVKLRSETRLTPGDTFLMGRQVLRFERFEHDIAPKSRASDGTRYMGSPPPGGRFKLMQIGIAGVVQNVHCMPETGAVIGREKGDLIFLRDKFMSSRHAQIFPREDGHYYLSDLQSSNGTWLKIWERKQLAGGDFVFLGQQLFRVEIG